jgi:ribosomal subunit interface protein
MKMPLHIRFQGLEASEAVESAAREKAAKLDQFCPDLMSCTVTVELLHKHRQQGRQFEVRIDVTLPQHELSVSRVHDEDAYVALRDAFDAMRRQVEDAVRRTRGQEKHHVEPLRGEVVRLDPEGRHGFIRAGDGEDYYFAPDNVTGVPFEHLEIGMRVQFLPAVAAEARQAKRVSVGKHRVG